MINKKTFADLKVGDILYFGTIDSDHIMMSRLVSIEMLPDLDNCYTNNSDIRFTPIEFGYFDINKIIVDKHDVIYYTFNDCGIWCGTSKIAVANHILNAIKSKIDVWNNKMNRLINNSR